MTKAANKTRRHLHTRLREVEAGLYQVADMAARGAPHDAIVACAAGWLLDEMLSPLQARMEIQAAKLGPADFLDRVHDEGLRAIAWCDERGVSRRPVPRPAEAGSTPAVEPGTGGGGA